MRRCKYCGSAHPHIIFADTCEWNTKPSSTWDSAEYNAKRAEAAEVEIKRLETENETLKQEYFLMRELIDLCATRNDDGDYLDPEFAFEKAIEIQKALRDLSA